MDVGSDLARALKDAEERSRFQERLLAAVGEAVIATDLEGRILFWNPAAERLYGWSAAEVLGRSIVDVTPALADRERAERIMASLRRGERWVGEFPVRRKDGSEFTARITDTPILNAAGALIAIVGVSSDVTAQAREEQRQRFLSQASGLLSESLDEDTLLHAISELTVPQMADWCFVLRVEAGHTRTLPLSHHADPGKAELARRLLRDYAAPEHSPTAAALEGRPTLIAELTPRLIERFARDPVHATMLRDIGVGSVVAAPIIAGRSVLGTITLAAGEPGRYDPRDLELLGEIGHRAGTAVENARLYRASQEANQAKANFLAIVSHELRTPLNAITGYTDLILDGVAGEVAEQQRQYLDRVKTSAAQLVQIIDEILMFARLESGREVVRVADVDAAEIVRHAAEAIESSTRSKGLRLDLRLPQAAIPLRTDGRMVTQILGNLAANAVKFTEKGGIELGARPLDDGAIVWIRDTGPGIAADQTERIFDAFWQAEPANTRAVGGTGLGLAVVRRLATLIAGEVDVKSEPGRGSVFELRLPSLRPTFTEPSDS